jgi:2-polyprenyl-3-methyl-5-hydroxy-6-metoxy-1,4-benzoquinol methylase
LIRKDQDAFGQEIYAYYTGKDVTEVTEREDGFISTGRGPKGYFDSFEDWFLQEQEAMQFVQGRVLDVGCGAGRVCLYLQGQGFEVLGIDNSPLALEVCRARGVKNLSLTPLKQVSSHLGTFDTIVMLGNNFGLFESYQGAKRMLKRFHRLTTPAAHIIAQSNNIYQTTDPLHLAYQARNRQLGRMSGQIRLRVRYQTCKGPWFDYLMVSPDEMQDILVDTGWSVERFIYFPESPLYIAIIGKEKALHLP